MKTIKTCMISKRLHNYIANWDGSNIPQHNGIYTFDSQNFNFQKLMVYSKKDPLSPYVFDFFPGNKGTSLFFCGGPKPMSFNDPKAQINLNGYGFKLAYYIHHRDALLNLRPVKIKKYKNKKKCEYYDLDMEFVKHLNIKNWKVSGHWRLQPFGPKNKLRKKIWISEHKKGHKYLTNEFDRS